MCGQAFSLLQKKRRKGEDERVGDVKRMSNDKLCYKGEKVG